MEAEGWSGADKDEAMSMKDLYRTRLLEDILFGSSSYVLLSFSLFLSFHSPCSSSLPSRSPLFLFPFPPSSLSPHQYTVLRSNATSDRSRARVSPLSSFLLLFTHFILPSLEQKVTAVLKHCMDTTSPSRTWMVEHKGRLPHDYSRFPGKMDHTTCVALKVCRLFLSFPSSMFFLPPSLSFAPLPRLLSIFWKSGLCRW